MAAAQPSPILETARDLRDLRLRKADWDDLARDALEANVFYESTWLLPLLRHFGPVPGLLFLFVYLPGPGGPAGRRLIGLFPFRRAPSRLLFCPVESTFGTNLGGAR